MPRALERAPRRGRTSSCGAVTGLSAVCLRGSASEAGSGVRARCGSARVIDEALLFLRNRLNAHLKSFDGAAAESSEDRVVFIDGETMDPIRFKLGAVSLLLMNTEEEKI